MDSDSGRHSGRGSDSDSGRGSNRDLDVDAVVFDVFGTMTDWRSGVAAELAAAGGRAGLHADWAAVTDDWRRGYRPILGRVLSGDLPWQPLDTLHRTTLDEVLPQHGLGALGEEERAGLVRAWHRLRAWEDAPRGLETLHASRLVTATLSNGGRSCLLRAIPRV